MVDPNMKPVPPAVVPVVPIFVQSWGVTLAVLFTTGVILPATAIAVTQPIIVSAPGFLLINASASGEISAMRLGAMILRIDGVKVPLTAVAHQGGVGIQPNWAIAARVAIAAGAHTVTVEFGLGSPLTVLTIDPATNPDTDSVSLTIIESAA